MDIITLTPGQRTITTEFSGEYVGSWTDTGTLSDFFQYGTLHGAAQTVFGIPASNLPESTVRNILPVGTVVEFGGQQVRIGKRGARIIR